MHQVGQRIRPKGPYRAQPFGKRAEEKHRAADGAQHYKSPQLAIGAAQKKQEHGASDGQAVQGIQQPRELGEPQAKGAQQVIQQSDGQPQQNGLDKDQQLLRDLDPHRYPNRRLKNPPRPVPWSS